MRNKVPELPSYAAWSNGVVPRGSGRQTRLFCFPFAGGGASAYWPWIAELKPEIEILALQLPGRESRWGEPAYSQMAPLICRLADDLEPLLVPPFALFGHSMGALIAFELARELKRRGKPSPERLIVSAARAPQIPDPDKPLHGRTDSELLSELRRLHGIPRELLDHAELLQVLLPTLRVDLKLCETYVYSSEPPLGCSISAFGGDRDSKVALDFLDAWRYHTEKDFRLKIFPGDHFYLKPARKELLDAVRRDLKENS